MPPPTPVVLLPEIVLLSMSAVPVFISPLPELFEIVLSRKIRLSSLRMPPP